MSTINHRELRPSWPPSTRHQAARLAVPPRTQVLRRVLASQGAALLAAAALAALLASPAQARTSLSGLQQELNALRATVCGDGVSQAACDAAMADAVGDRLTDLEAQTELLSETVCSLAAGASTGDLAALGCDDIGALRLVGGNTEDEGRLEVFGNGEWGTVCDDRFDDVDAGVACRQLGYSAGTTVRILSGQPGFEPGTGPIFLDDLSCIGTEGRLVDCPSRDFGQHNCSHFEDVGVRCTD